MINNKHYHVFIGILLLLAGIFNIFPAHADKLCPDLIMPKNSKSILTNDAVMPQDKKPLLKLIAGHVSKEYAVSRTLLIKRTDKNIYIIFYNNIYTAKNQSLINYKIGFIEHQNKNWQWYPVVMENNQEFNLAVDLQQVVECSDSLQFIVTLPPILACKQVGIITKKPDGYKAFIINSNLMDSACFL